MAKRSKAGASKRKSNSAGTRGAVKARTVRTKSVARPARRKPASRKPGRIRHIDAQSPGRAPALRPIQRTAFDRVVAACANFAADDPSAALEAWLAEGLRSLPPSQRKGTALVQIGEPGPDEMPLFEENLLRKDDGVVACLTGDPALVQSWAARAHQRQPDAVIRASHGFPSRLDSLDVCAIVVDNDVILAEDGAFDGLERRLCKSGWNVWIVDDGDWYDVRGYAADRMLAKLPKALPTSKPEVSARGATGTASTSPLPNFSVVPDVPDDSRWVLTVLRRQSGTVSAEDVCLFQSDDPDEVEEADVRAWYYRLFEEHGPWIIVPDGVGTPTSIDTAFPRPNFGGMPTYYRFQKSPRTTAGREWRLVSSDGAPLGSFIVRRVARLSGREVNALDRLLHGASDVPLAILEVGEHVESWHFGALPLGQAR